MLNSIKFILYILGGVFIILSIYSYIVLEHKILYMGGEYPMWRHVQNTINNNNNNAILIGDSRAKAGFIPNKFNTDTINSVNLALGGITPIEGYYILKNYLSNNNTPKYLLMSFAPSHIYEQDTYWERTARFGFLEDNDYSDIYNTSLILNDKTTLANKMNEPSLILGVENKHLDYKIFTQQYLTELKNGILYQRWCTNNQILKYLNTSRGHYYFGKRLGSSRLNTETKHTFFKPSKLINYYLEKTIELANKNSIKVFWYTMPFNKSSFNTVSTTFKKGYNQYIENLVDKHKITALNTLSYLGDAKFSDPSHLYMGIDEATEDIKIKFHSKL